MKYMSTRGGATTKKITASEAILKGIADDGGLYVPERIPAFDETGMTLGELVGLNYVELAVEILQLYLSDFSTDEISRCAADAYGDNFDDPDIAPLVRVKNTEYFFLELFHGKTLAFKDMALSILPSMLKLSAEKTGGDKKILILTATSGDTGKAALEGFSDENSQIKVPNPARPFGTQIEIAVFFPEDGVSAIQKKQMTTQRGGNTFVAGINGNFDDAQNGVKKMFVNESLKNDLRAAGFELSSANSINIGRLLPQIVYYFYAYGQMVKKYGLKIGEKINFTVPTGNFGNILAAFYAKKMGLPVEKLICASNDNRVLFDFFNTGEYDKNREFIRTVSPSMDILISSNLERFIHYFAGDTTKEMMNGLAKNGAFTFSSRTDEIAGYYASETETLSGIREMWEQGYLIDTHTSVAYCCYKKFLETAGSGVPNVVVATASPYKFAEDVCYAITGEKNNGDSFAAMETLSRVTGTPIPGALGGLKGLADVHTTVCDPEDMEKIIRGRYL